MVGMPQAEKLLPKTQPPERLLSSVVIRTSLNENFFFLRIQKIPGGVLTTAHNLINYSCFLKDENKIWRKVLTMDWNSVRLSPDFSFR